MLEEEVANGVRTAEVQAKELEKIKKAKAVEAGEDQEREEMIADLRSEGEALARQNGKQAEVIRKLRAKEKVADKEIEKLKTESEKAKAELERLSKSLAEKNSVEGSQSEAIKNLTDANQAWEVENKKLKNDLEDNVEKSLACGKVWRRLTGLFQLSQTDCQPMFLSKCSAHLSKIPI